MFELIKETILAPKAEWCSPAVECGIFPGLARNSDGSLCLLAVCGSEFESSDQRIVIYRGKASGTEWELQGDFGAIHVNGHIFTGCAKPTVLPDGSIIALGYGYECDKPEMSLSDYADKFGHFPTVHNFTMFSRDGGRTYSAPEYFATAGGIEFSGPALQVGNRLLAFGPPFSTSATGQRGLCYESLDGGHSWTQKSVFFEGDNITAWETRSALLPDGRIALIFWAFDLKTQKHLTNRLAISDDIGQSWKVIDTGIPGQASNFLVCDNDTLGILYAKREGTDPGVYLAKTKLAGNSLTVQETLNLYDATHGANANGNILNQFANLKFGQPSITRLADNSLLLLFWRRNEFGRYEIVLRKFR